ncbi:MAG: GNAT family N-acetyltransferase [Brooklawnia sp.]|uniref:GNAT family N-acetyltransferase n=1 Tax=Brooklawnia sp. TaxID=2699740 RepID=UPI003C782EB9
MSLTIERCTDPEVLVEPHREAIAEAYAGYFDTPFPSDETLRDEWRTLLDAGATVLLARLHGRPVGTVAARVVDGEGWLARLYVHPEAQGRGVGRALMAAALAVLREQGCRRANLWVLAVHQPAIEIYRHWGWRPADTEPHAPFGLPELRFCLPLTGA